MSDRIQSAFEKCKAENRKALVGFLTAGDPDIEQSEKNVRIALDNGVDVLELGLPFSDPTADGPAIQLASQRALASGVNIAKVLEMVRRIRADYDVPIILFGYANPMLSYGYESLCADASDAGANGLLVVDMPYEEADELTVHMDKHDLAFITLVAPTTPKDRAKMILKGARGFVYYIMVMGVTGERAEIASGIDEHVAALRECTDLPIVVGFGVSSGELARAVGKSADGVVVGSALVKATLTGDLAELTRDLRDGLAG